MARKFKTVDYEQSGQQKLTIDDCLPADHLARFVVNIVAMLDLSAFYAYYAATGSEAIDPKVLLALLLYAYATGMFSSRQIEQATYEVIPLRFLAGGLHPDHSTLAWFRKQFLAEIKLVFAQVLLIAHELGYLTLGNISLDGSRIHADASKITDPASRIMKNSTNAGFDQYYNVQVAVEQANLFVVGNSLSNHPVDTYEAIPTVEAIPPEVGHPTAAALDKIYFAPRNI
jgi:transposase